MGSEMCIRDRSMAVVMLDIDNFKRFNDEHGHAAGDAVLSRVGTAIAESLRASDFAARYGGEEFCLIVAPEHGYGARELAERVRGAVEGIELPDLPHVTISAGVSVAYPRRGEELGAKGLVDAADRGLYRAKDRGRNRVEVWLP